MGNAFFGALPIGSALFYKGVNLVKKKVLLMFITLLSICLSIFTLAACATTDDEIRFKTLVANGQNVYGEVSNDISEFSFYEEIFVSGKATYIVDNDKNCSTPIPSKTVDLNVGDNVFYVLETIGNNVKLYTVTIHRKALFTVVFDTNGGALVDNQVVEEGSFATEPTITKTGYTFFTWDYDFNLPITSDIVITASWTPNSNTAYKVEYYLQNLEDNNYSLSNEYSFDDRGTTNTIATITPLEIEHYTFDEKHTGNVLSGNITAEGTLVLKVYYLRNNYTLSINNSSGGHITNSGIYKYGKEITSTANAYLGYDFVGWYNNEELLSTDSSFTFAINQNIKANFKVKKEMANFNFSSTVSTSNITGIKDKTVTEVIVPDYVTSISRGAFNGCSSLQEITLPFVGASKHETTNNFFGYIFGAGSPVYNDDYVPNSLQKVILTSATNISNSAFGWCVSLKNVIIGSSVTTIGEEAFRNCSLLTSVTIGSGVTSIGDGAFVCCYTLTNIIVDADNREYKTIDSNLYSIDGKTLIQYAIGAKDVIFEIPNDVTTIGAFAFYGSDSLTNIRIPNSVTTIRVGAFAYCNKLTNIIIPNTITIINSSTFEGCGSLQNIEIPDSVTSIGYYAFAYCDSLTNITFSDISTWYITKSFLDWQNKTNGAQTSVSDVSTNATNFNLTYHNYYWYKK